MRVYVCVSECVFVCVSVIHAILYLYPLQVTIPGQEPRKLCGNESPRLLHTNSHWVLLEYHTDWAGLSRGWRLHYTTQSERGTERWSG